MSVDTQYAVYRREGNKRHLNGRFDEKKDAQKCAERVKAFHGADTVVEIDPPKKAEDLETSCPASDTSGTAKRGFPKKKGRAPKSAATVAEAAGTVSPA